MDYDSPEESKMLQRTSADRVFVQRLLILLSVTIMWFQSIRGAPTTDAASHSVVRLPNTKVDEFKVTTVQDKDVIKQLGCLSPSATLKAEASATMALFYVNQSNFILIAIDPYDTKYFGSFISSTSKEFDLSKIYELYQIEEDYAGLVRVLKVNDKMTLNLEGQSPSSKESLFRVSRYLCIEGDAPVADYLLFESMLYPKHYIRRYDNATVDCEVPEGLTVPPSDRKHFYWRASKTQSPDGNNDYVQLLSSQNDDSLTFIDNMPVMCTTKLL